MALAMPSGDRETQNQDDKQMNREITLKQRSRDRFDVALTGLYGAETPNQYANLVKWNIAARINVTTNYGHFIDHGGVRFVKVENPSDITLKQVIGSFMLECRVGHIIAVCDPSVKLRGDAEALFRHVDSSGMALSWAAKAGYGPTPELFVFSGGVLPHFYREIPPTFQFSDPVWREWLNAWLDTNMQAHRYFDGNAFNLVEAESCHAASPSTPPVVSDEPMEPKKRPGRPSKKKG